MAFGRHREAVAKNLTPETFIKMVQQRAKLDT